MTDCIAANFSRTDNIILVHRNQIYINLSQHVAAITIYEDMIIEQVGGAELLMFSPRHL